MNSRVEPLVGKAVTDAIDQVFLIPLIMGLIAFVIAVVIERVHVVKSPSKQPAQLDAQEDEVLIEDDIPEEVRLQRAASMGKREKESSELYQDGIFGQEM